MNTTKEVKIGVVGVDSGQILITDPCYLSDWKDTDYIEPKKEGEYSYAGACGRTLSAEKAGQLNFSMGHAGAGVVSSTAYGDGSYPVYATYDEGRISSLRIDFEQWGEEE